MALNLIQCEQKWEQSRCSLVGLALAVQLQQQKEQGAVEKGQLRSKLKQVLQAQSALMACSFDNCH